jgi:hypothetical protein
VRPLHRTTLLYLNADDHVLLSSPLLRSQHKRTPLQESTNDAISPAADNALGRTESLAPAEFSRESTTVMTALPSGATVKPRPPMGEPPKATGGGRSSGIPRGGAGRVQATRKVEAQPTIAPPLSTTTTTTTSTSAAATTSTTTAPEQSGRLTYVQSSRAKTERTPKEIEEGNAVVENFARSHPVVHEEADAEVRQRVTSAASKKIAKMRNKLVEREMELHKAVVEVKTLRDQIRRQVGCNACTHHPLPSCSRTHSIRALHSAHFLPARVHLLRCALHTSQARLPRHHLYDFNSFADDMRSSALCVSALVAPPAGPCRTRRWTSSQGKMPTFREYSR